MSLRLKDETNGEDAQRTSLLCFMAWVQKHRILIPRYLDEAHELITRYLKHERSEIVKHTLAIIKERGEKPMYYLNNSGSRWVTDDMRFVLVLPDGTRTVRKARYCYSLGNFGCLAYTYKGKPYKGLPKAYDGSETGDDKATGDQKLPHIFHEESAGHRK